MSLFKLKVKDTELEVAVADTKELRYKGLSGTKRLGRNKGMLFIFPNKTMITMVMRDMNYDLDFILMDSNWKVIQLGSLDKEDNFGIKSEVKVQMILEVNKGIISEYGIKVGDSIAPEKRLRTQLKGVKKFKEGGKFEIIGDKVFQVKVDDVLIDPSKMQVLDTKGEVVANVSGGARVFSREDTSELIKLAEEGEDIKLARAMIRIIKKQNTQKQDHVRVK